MYAQIYLTEELVALAGQRGVLVHPFSVVLLGVGNTMALQIVLELEAPAAHLARKLLGLVHQLVPLEPERGGKLLAADTAGVVKCHGVWLSYIGCIALLGSATKKCLMADDCPPFGPLWTLY